MIARIYARINARDFTCFINQNADALGVARLRIVASAIRETEGSRGVAKQRDVEVIFLGERGVLIDAVETGAHHGDVLLIKVGFLIAEPATLNRSPGGVGRWIEP